MDPQQDPTGDYGYDLAHEAAGRQGAPAGAHGSDERPPRDDGPAEPDGDLGYDEVHDFRRR